MLLPNDSADLQPKTLFCKKIHHFPFDFHFYHIIDAFWTIIKPGALAPARAWFLKIDPVRIVGMRACMFVCG